MIVQKLNDKVRKLIDGDTESFELDGIISAIIEVVSDGDIDTEDYPKLVDAVTQLAQEIAELIDIPLLPELAEVSVLKTILIYAVRAGYRYAHIPLPSSK